MSVLKIRGIVIKEAARGEADKILTLFGKETGKITVYAKGARMPKSKYLAGSQLFTYSDFVLYKKGSFFSVTQIDIIHNFYNIRTDYDRLCCGSSLIGTLDKILYQQAPSSQLLLLLLKALTALESGRVSPELIRITFEFKLLECEGYMPEVNFCERCGGEVFSSFFLGASGLLCGACLSGCNTVKISETALYAIKHILSSDIKSLFGFNVSDDVMDELNKSCRALMKYHFE